MKQPAQKSDFIFLFVFPEVFAAYDSIDQREEVVRCGKTSGTDAFLYRDWNGDRNADRGKCDYCDRSRSLSALWISYVLQIKNSPRFCEGNF